MRGNITKLFITSLKPNKPLSKGNVATWEKSIFAAGGIRVKLSTQHSTRSATNSKKQDRKHQQRVLKIGGGAGFIRLQIILLRASHYEKVRTATEAIAVKLLQRNDCNEAIATKSMQQSHCKVTSFFLIFNSSMFVSREISNNLVSLW